VLRLLRSLLLSLRSALRTRTDLALENLALRQQLAALRQQVKRPQVHFADRLFWSWLHRFWGRWREALIVVRPETVIRWHRLGFKRFWTWRSRRRGPGRASIDRKVRELIERVATANPL
jgi:putative transposase